MIKKKIFGPGWALSGSRVRIFAVAFMKSMAHFRMLLGTRHNNCPVCDTHARFYSFGSPARLDAMCSNCGALERHRQMMLWLQRSETRWEGRRILHFAPDFSIQSFLREKAGTYIGADIVYTPGCRVLNIEALDLLDASVDIIVCSHVLEHVDDRKALKEMRRVLAPNGLALIMVPVIYGWHTTYENPDVTVPSDKSLHFGQDDHLRYYGIDIEDRIRAAGFKLEKFVAQEPDCLNYGLIRGETLYVAVAQT